MGIQLRPHEPIIYCFINGSNDLGVFPIALAEDGHVLAGHCSSNEWFAKHDIGIDAEGEYPDKWKHEKYKAHYPDGYKLIWMDDVENHEGVQEAIKKYEAINDERQ